MHSTTTLKIYLIPSASKNEIIGLYGPNLRIKIKVKSPPIDGKANKELINFLAKTFKIAKSKISIKKGLTSKNKDLEIDKHSEECEKILQGFIEGFSF